MSQPGQNLTEVFELPAEVNMEAADSYSPPGLSSTGETSMEAYPFCKEIGLNLQAVEPRKINEKLGFHLLTYGVINEVTSLAKELSGSHWQIIHEILVHNFDLDLQSGKTKLAKNHSGQVCFNEEQSSEEAVEFWNTCS